MIKRAGNNTFHEKSSKRFSVCLFCSFILLTEISYLKNI